MNDNRPGTSTKGKPYQLIVLTRPACAKTIKPGHAMIAIGDNRYPEYKKARCLEAWGFYPDGIRDELAQDNLHLYTRSVVIPITSEQYRKIRKAVEDWKLTDPNWILGFRDCTDFVQKMLASIGIHIEDYLWPDNFGLSLESRFGSKWGHCRP